MKVTRTDNSSTNVGLTVNLDAKDLAPLKTHVLGHFAEKVRVPGFRAGTAPIALVEKQIDQRELLDEFMEHAINEFYRKAITAESLRPVGQPDIAVKKFVPYTDLEFTATQDVIGAIALPNYKTMKLAKTKPTVTTKDVDDVITSLLKRSAERTEVKRAAKNGDEAVIDFEGTDAKGSSIAGADGKDYPLLLGSKTFIPGFEEEVIGLKAGDTKEFKITFPADYGAAALQNQKVTFKVSVKSVQELKDAKLDDAFVATVGPFKTVAELKADIKKQLLVEKQQQADRDYENQLARNIAAKAKIDIPATIATEQIMRAEEEEKRNLAAKGQTWQEHLKEEGITQDEHRERQRPEAIERVKAGIVLSEIADAEKLEVTPEELEIRLQILKAQYQDPAMLVELDKPENRQDIANRILTEKTIAKLVDYASKK